ncbi:Protein soga3 [Mactra antiquata]
MVTLALIGKQSSLEHEIAELKRELYDGKERELDLKDQLQFIETNGKKLQKKVRDLEEENDSLSKQIKKLSVEKSKSNDKTSDGAAVQPESEVEMKIQLDLTEKELLVLKRNMTVMDEENESLHREMFLLEKKLKDQERQLSVVPEPTSPKSYYEDKIKDYEKEANEFRSKLLDKENEIERLYAQIHSIQSLSGHGKSLRRTRSLDYETDYNLVVELRRQVELCQQENEKLKERIDNLKDDKSCLMGELNSVRGKTTDNDDSSFSILAVVETEDSDKVITFEQVEMSKTLLINKIKDFVDRINSITTTHLPRQLLESTELCIIDDILETSGDLLHVAPSGEVVEASDSEQITGISCETNAFIILEKQQIQQGIYHRSLNDAEVRESLQTISESRDLDKLLSDVERNYSVLVKRLSDCCTKMDSEREKVVPSQYGEANGQFALTSEEMDRTGTGSCGNDSLENKMSQFSENLAREIIKCATCAKNGNSIQEKNEMEFTSDENICSNKIDNIKNGNMNVSLPDVHIDDDNELSRKYYKDKIAYLEEEIDDLRLIIKSKEEKNVLLDDEVEELQAYVKKLQDDSRQREMELLSEMDLIHGKNEVDVTDIYQWICTLVYSLFNLCVDNRSDYTCIAL